MATIKIKRGLKATIPSSANLGEPIYTTDTKELYVGNGDGNALTQFLSSKGFLTDINRIGFVNPAEVTLTLTGTNLNTVNLVRVGSNFRYYFNGEIITISANKSVTLPTTTAGVYIIYMDTSDGTLKSSDYQGLIGGLPLSQKLESIIMVAGVCYNGNCTPKGWLFDELHSIAIDKRMHYYLHTTVGTQKMSGGIVSTPTAISLPEATPADANHTLNITAAMIADEDRILSLDALIGSTGKFTVFYRRSASEWGWFDNENYPFKVGANNRLMYDNASTTMLECTNNRYINGYLLLTNIKSTSGGSNARARYIWIFSQTEYTNEALAEAESFLDLSLSTLTNYLKESVVVAQVTWQTNNIYDTVVGKSKLMRIQVQNISLSVASGQTATNDHQALINRTAAGAHPSSAISYDGTSSGIAATTTQAAIDAVNARVGFFDM